MTTVRCCVVVVVVVLGFLVSLATYSLWVGLTLLCLHSSSKILVNDSVGALGQYLYGNKAKKKRNDRLSIWKINAIIKKAEGNPALVELLKKLKN